MLVKNLAATGYFSYLELAHNRDKSAKVVSSSARILREDSYIPSNSLHSEVKAKDLSEIKNRISSGFYNSTAVNDDLTECFSSIFKKTLSTTA
ncbi:MAG: hypothetical protein FWE23_01100 [Chitinivibrionia bacterium]|nr:hypothetical protein [Chitinivibrionia bacterium]